jgi:hypothetical protein
MVTAQAIAKHRGVGRIGAPTGGGNRPVTHAVWSSPSDMIIFQGETRGRGTPA